MLQIVDKNECLWENIKIIFDNTYIELWNDLEPDYENNCLRGLTLNDCLEEAKKRGYTKGTITVLSESYLQGQIYRYGNYDDDNWYLVGKLAGFA